MPLGEHAVVLEGESNRVSDLKRAISTLEGAVPNHLQVFCKGKDGEDDDASPIDDDQCSEEDCSVAIVIDATPVDEWTLRTQEPRSPAHEPRARNQRSNLNLLRTTSSVVTSATPKKSRCHT